MLSFLFYEAQHLQTLTDNTLEMSTEDQVLIFGETHQKVLIPFTISPARLLVVRSCYPLEIV